MIRKVVGVYFVLNIWDHAEWLIINDVPFFINYIVASIAITLLAGFLWDRIVLYLWNKEKFIERIITPMGEEKYFKSGMKESVVK